jgi:hypothetical protein
MAALRRLRFRRLAALHRLLRLLRAVMTAFRRLRLRRPAALHRLSRLLSAILPAFCRLRLRRLTALHRHGALHRHLWWLLCVLMASLRRHLIVPRPLQSCPSMRMR